MTNVERTGFRDQAYSAWHRELDDSLSFIDIDWIEWCKTCSRPLAMYELALDNGKNDGKNCWVTRKLAELSGLKGYLVLYHKDRRGRIDGFRVRELAPRERTEFTALTPDRWAAFLYKLRWCHPIAPPDPQPAKSVSCGVLDPDGSPCFLVAGHKATSHESANFVWPVAA